MSANMLYHVCTNLDAFFTLSTCIASHRELWTCTPRSLCSKNPATYCIFSFYIWPPKCTTSYLSGLNSICHYSVHIFNRLYPAGSLCQLPSLSITLLFVSSATIPNKPMLFLIRVDHILKNPLAKYPNYWCKRHIGLQFPAFHLLPFSGMPLAIFQSSAFGWNGHIVLWVKAPAIFWLTSFHNLG